MSGDGDDKTQILSRPPVAEKPVGPKATLRCVDTSVLKDKTGVEISLDGEPVTVGRGEENVIALNAHGISRVHARLFLEGGGWWVEDVGSTNGTRVNNSRIDRRALDDGDTVAFGRVCYKYNLVEARTERPAAHDIDLGSGDKTMMMRPGQVARAQAEPKPPETARGDGHTTGSHARPRPAPSTRQGTGPVLWVIVAVLAAGIAVGAAFALGLI